MEYTKDYLRKIFNEVIEQSERKGYIGIVDARKLTEIGIPILDICRDKSVFDTIRARFDRWLNSL